MFSGLWRWLRNIPIDDPIDRQIAFLIQLALIFLMATIVAAYIISIVVFGIFPLEPERITPGSFLIVVIPIALVLLRRGHFRRTLWLVVGLLLVSQTYNVFTNDLDARGELVLSFIIPFTLAGLFISRRALIATYLYSTAVVFIAAYASQNNGQPETSVAAVAALFFLVYGFFSVLIDFFRSTLRRALEDAVRRTEEFSRLSKRLEVTLTSIGDAVIATDAKGRVTLMNAVSQELTGWTQEEAAGESLSNVFKIVNEETRLPVESPVDKVMREGTIVGLANHTILIAKDGREIPIDDSGAPIRDDNGKIVGVVLVFRDITERKEAEEAQLKAETRFARVLAATAEAVIAVDSTQRIILFNQSAERIFGYTAAEMLGQSLDALLPPDAVEKHRLFTRDFADGPDIARGMGYRSGELFAKRKDGTVFPIEASISKLTQGDEVILTVFIQDITKRKQAEERTVFLYQLTAKLSRALTPEQVADAIVDEGLVPLGIYRGALALLTEDRTAARIVKQHGTDAEVLARFETIPLSAATPTSDAIRTGRSIWITSFEDYMERYPDVAKTVSSERKVQAVAAIPLIVNEQVIGCLGASFYAPMRLNEGDRTFLLTLAEQCALALERSRLYVIEQKARIEAEEANRLKLQFLAMISHELRTPLTSIKGFATTLLAQDVEWEAESQQEFIMIIDEEADKLTDLVDHLLELSRLQVGALHITPNIQSISSVIDTARPELITLVDNHQLLIDIPENLPLVFADTQRISQVITNLVGNAVRYSPEGTEISITAHLDEGFVQVDVADEGVGIDPSEQHVVFEAFRQAERKVEGHRQGAGLGLAICKGLVEAHGGRIWIQEKSLPGTVISFTLPVYNPRNEGSC